MYVHENIWNKTSKCFSQVLFCGFFSKKNISYILQRKPLKGWRNIFKTEDRKKNPQKFSYVSIYAYETFSSAGNAVTDTLSNAGNIECCIKIL